MLIIIFKLSIINVLIDTWWNVNDETKVSTIADVRVLIDT